MSIPLKPLNQQVMVITGASSGIGLATAEAAAAKGVKVVLAARSKQALENIVQSIRSRGGEAYAVAADVASREELERVAQEAVIRFGRIDTWVNNAGVSIYGRLDEISEQDSRRLFDTNFWGVYHGSLVALHYLKTAGGAIINVGSEVSEAVIPLQGIYAASKHAVKGFTDALRVEIEEVSELPVAITLIQPTAVDTPYPQHAKNYMPQEPKLPDPMIEPEKVAEAILAAAVSQTRALRVGTMSKVNTMTAKLMPKLADKLSSKQVDRQHYDEPPRNPNGALYQPSEMTTMVGKKHGAGGTPPQ
ncbi:MAG: SDR family oxidoreductase [Bdellovibrionota bacterium]